MIRTSMQNWLRERSHSLFLNAFALLGAVLGLANAALAWRLYGTSSNADVWMLALLATAALCLVSQLGVEQFAVFSAEAHADDGERGRRFDRDCMTWAIGFGVAIALALTAASSSVAALFGNGYAAAQRARVGVVLLPLLLQVMCTPALYVFRQQLLLSGRSRLAIVMNNIFPAVQFAVLASAWATHSITPEHAALVTGLVSAALAAWAVLGLGEAGVLRHKPDWVALRPFIRASFAMRTTHSVHNFLVVVLTSSALSAGVEGTVALYQYAKKLADGLSSISVGPHLSVYHAAQARAWAMVDPVAFRRNMRTYLISAFPLLFAATLLFGAGAGAAVHFVHSFAQRMPPSGFALLFLLLAWQTLISLESIPVGVVVIDNRTEMVLFVNSLYVLMFFTVIHFVLVAPYTGIAVAAASLCCQLISASLYALIAHRLMRQRFAR